MSAPDKTSQDATDQCTCWAFESDDGVRHPLSWARLHDQIRLVDHTGVVWQGPSPGAGWWGPTDTPEALLEVETEQGTAVFSFEQVRSVTPVGGIFEVEELLTVLRGVFEQAPGADMPTAFRLVRDAHTSADIEVTFTSHSCTPPLRPPWGV